MQKAFLFLTALSVAELLSRQMSSKGGSIETDVTLLSVRPKSWPSWSVDVTIDTPVHHLAQDVLNFSGVMFAEFALNQIEQFWRAR